MSEALRLPSLANSMSYLRSMSWYAKRLSVMKPFEIFHRLGEHCVLTMLQIQHRLAWPVVDHTTEDVSQFAFCSDSAIKLPELPWSLEIDRSATEALLTGKLSVLGCEWSWRPERDVWHEAPDTQRRWPQTFFGHVHYREGNPYGDVRVAWEPSRLQHLVTLGLFARKAEPSIRQRAVALLEAQFLSWIEANPLLTGIHYISVMECALRILAVCHAIDLVREWLQNPHRIWPALLTLVHGHIELIGKRFSTYSSTGNHTVAEATALVYVGCLFPEMPQARRWMTLGLSLLEKESLHQILPDGGGAEQSFWYQRFISDLYGLVVTLLRHHNRPIPVRIEQAFDRSRLFLSAFGDCSNHFPRIGDGDNGYALSPFLSFSKRQNRWTPGLTTFDASGYSVIRSRTHDEQQLIFDHGSLGMAPCFAHGHADALSVIFHSGMHEILIDPGTYTYIGDPLWRSYFRGTKAHNTVMVDGLDQAVQETTFMWSQPFRAQVAHREESPHGTITIVACHDGYQKRVGVTHWRAVVYEPSGFWFIWDKLTGSGAHHLELNWHLGIEPKLKMGSCVLQCNDRTLHMVIEGGVSTLHRGETKPISGWRSRHYGVKEPISTLRTEYTGTLPHEFMTRIWVGDGVEPIKLVFQRLSFLRRLVDETQASGNSGCAG